MNHPTTWSRKRTKGRKDNVLHHFCYARSDGDDAVPARGLLRNLLGRERRGSSRIETSADELGRGHRRETQSPHANALGAVSGQPLTAAPKPRCNVPVTQSVYDQKHAEIISVVRDPIGPQYWVTRAKAAALGDSRHNHRRHMDWPARN